MSAIDPRMIGFCLVMLAGAVPQATAQTSSQGLIRTIVQEIEAADGSRAKPGPRFVDVTPVLGELSDVLGQEIVSADVGRTLPEGYSMATKDSVLKCPGAPIKSCEVQNGGVVVRVDSLSSDRSSVRAVVTRWHNSIMGRGVFRATWEIVLDRGEKGWVPVGRRMLRQS